MQLVKSHKSFGGQTSFWTHDSRETQTSMRFATFVPEGKPVTRCILWLSGLTCTEENFMSKSGIQRLLLDMQTMVVAPDTSPRGLHLPGEHDRYDFGSGAGFYLNATTPGYATHYRMFSYIVEELCPLVKETFGVSSLALRGHSMGGHGALVLGLRHPDLFQDIAVFAPIVNPSEVPWGRHAFTGYLGETSWSDYDACELLRRGYRHPAEIVIYQGTQDEFLGTQLQPEVFSQVAAAVGQKHEIRWCEGYDHSYYFIASFLGEVVGHMSQHGGSMSRA